MVRGNPVILGYLRNLHQLLIPTKWNSYYVSIRERMENLSERRLKSLGSLVTLNQRVPGSSPGAPTIDFTRLSSLHNKSI
jgi:hypothetical protein